MSALLPIADWGGHHDGDGVLMVLVMVLFWGGLAALVVWALRDRVGHGHHGAGAAPHPPEAPRDVLRRRLAEGAIDVEEFERRLAALEGGAATPTPGADAPGEPPAGAGPPSG